MDPRHNIESEDDACVARSLRLGYSIQQSDRLSGSLRLRLSPTRSPIMAFDGRNPAKRAQPVSLLYLYTPWLLLRLARKRAMMCKNSNVLK